jgi:hypothetical protein
VNGNLRGEKCPGIPQPLIGQFHEAPPDITFIYSLPRGDSPAVVTGDIYPWIVLVVLVWRLCRIDEGRAGDERLPNCALVQRVTGLGVQLN